MKIEGLFGSFTLHKNAARPAVFLIGGIGITPVLSILKQVTRDRAVHQLYLFFSNRRPEDAPLLDVLQTVAKQKPNFNFVPTMTR